MAAKYQIESRKTIYVPTKAKHQATVVKVLINMYKTIHNHTGHVCTTRATSPLSTPQIVNR